MTRHAAKEQSMRPRASGQGERREGSRLGERPASPAALVLSPLNLQETRILRL